MVDDDLVAPVGTEGSLNSLGYCTTCFYIAENGAIFGFVAGPDILVGFFRRRQVAGMSLLLVALFEETAVRRTGY